MTLSASAASTPSVLAIFRTASLIARFGSTTSGSGPAIFGTSLVPTSAAFSILVPTSSGLAAAPASPFFATS